MTNLTQKYKLTVPEFTPHFSWQGLVDWAERTTMKTASKLEENFILEAFEFLVDLGKTWNINPMASLRFPMGHESHDLFILNVEIYKSKTRHKKIFLRNIPWSGQQVMRQFNLVNKVQVYWLSIRIKYLKLYIELAPISSKSNTQCWEKFGTVCFDIFKFFSCSLQSWILNNIFYLFLNVTFGAELAITGNITTKAKRKITLDNLSYFEMKFRNNLFSDKIIIFLKFK